MNNKPPTTGRIFLSYARGDDEAFVERLCADLKDAGFKVWFDRESLMSRGLTFHQEIKDAIRTEVERVVYVGGPKAAQSPYVREEWQSALEHDHVVVTPILRRGDYDISVPGELGLLHCEDFRDDAKYASALAKLITNLKQPNPKLGALHGVPNLPAHFLARPGLMAHVRDALLVDLQKPQVITGADAKVGMQGMGGIGKSVLAAALARNREVRQSYPDGIVWVACGKNLNEDALLARQRDLAKDLGGDTSFTSLPQAQSVLRDLLQAKSVLLVLDDVWCARDAQAFDVLGPRCRMLITTRDMGILHSLHGEHIPVSLFTEPEALQLLADAVSTKEHPVAPENLLDEAREVVAECGCLPLAVALCGGMARKRNGDFSNVLERLRRADLDKIADRESINEQHRSIWRAMQASVEMLEPDEQRRFAELAVFDTARTVPEAAAATLWSHTGHLDALDTEDLLVNLSERSLVQLDWTPGADGKPTRRFGLHDLLHDCAVRMAGDAKTLHQTLLDAYRAKCPDGWHTGPNDGYFFENLCNHMIAREDWDGLVGNEPTPGPLTDLLFTQAKCEAGLVHELVSDYNAALAALPEFREENERNRRRDVAMLAYNKALREYAVVRYDWFQAKEHGEFRPEPPYPSLPAELKEGAEIALPEESSPRASRLRHFSNFVSGHIALLSECPCETLPLAFNQAKDGPVEACAARQLVDHKEPWIERSPRPPPPPLRPQCLRALEGHAGWFNSVSVSPDGRRAVSGGLDSTLRVWDLETGRCLRTLEGHADVVRSVSVSPDGRRAVSGSGDKTLRVWDLETGRCLRTLEGHTSGVCSVSASPDGRRAVSGSGDSTLRVWDLETGRCLRTLEGHTSGVWSVSASPDGRRAVSGSWDSTLRVWDLETGRCLRTLEGHAVVVWSVSVSPDGRRAVSGSGDKTLRVWDLETGRCLRTLEGHTFDVSSVSVSPDGRRAVSGSCDKTLRVWDLENSQCLRTLEGHAHKVWSVSVSPDGRRAVSGPRDRTLRVWDLETGRCLRTLEGLAEQVSSVSVSPDGRRAVLGSTDCTLRVWDLETGQCLCALEGLWSGVCSVSPDGRRVVSDICCNALRVWDLETGRCLATLESHAGDDASVHPCFGVSVSPDGRRAVSGNDDKTLRVWDLETGQCLRTLEGHADRVYSVSVSPDGRRVVSGPYDSTLRVWDLETGRCLATLEGHTSGVWSVSVSPDGRRAVSGSGDKTLRVWDLETGRCLCILEGHSSGIHSVSVSPDGRCALSGSEDKTLRVWDLESGECIAVYHCGAIASFVTFSSAGTRIVCGTDDGQMHFLTPVNFSPSEPPIVTPVRLWLFGEVPKRAIAPRGLRRLFGKGGKQVDGAVITAPGRWSDQITCRCAHCSRLFEPPPLNVETEPRHAKCPHCGGALMIKPFVTDAAGSGCVGRSDEGGGS